jgi:hypothetical protein
MTDVRTQRHASAPPGTPVMVDVYALGNGQFRHEWRFQDGSDSGTGAIKIPPKDPGQPGTPIHFKFHPEGTGLRFNSGWKNGICEAIWVKRDVCPEFDPSKDSEIEVNQDNELLLIVTDRNQDECSLRYNLRFKPDPDVNYYDPEIKNGGSN